MNDHRTRSAFLLALTIAAVSGAAADPPGPYDPYRTRAQIVVGGTGRNFTPSTVAGGHADFTRVALAGPGRYARIAADTLDDLGLPVMATSGHRVLTDWRDASARPIISTKPYIGTVAGDAPGSHDAVAGGAVSSPAAFDQWFRDVAGVNTLHRSDFTIVRQAGPGSYLFDGSLDSVVTGAPDYSYTYTFEVPFIHTRGQGYYVAAATNAEVWVYVDGQLVIDCGAGLGHIASLAVDDSIVMSNSARIAGPGNTPATVSTNSTDAGDLRLTNSAQIIGSAMCGPGGNPASVIQASAGAITGSRGVLPSGVPMPATPVPGDLGPSVGDVVYSGGTHTIAASFRCKTLTFQGNATVNISGAVRILSEEKCDVGNNCDINLLPGASLTLFVIKDFFLHNHAKLNANTGDPSRVTVVNLGSTPVKFDNNGDFFGNVISPLGPVEIGNNITVTGAILARSALLHNSAEFIGVGTVGELLGGAAGPGEQRIDLDRLAWLTEDRTHTISVFFANRRGRASTFRFETSMDLLNVAAVPAHADAD